jgi:hypothetical protein
MNIYTFKSTKIMHRLTAWVPHTAARAASPALGLGLLALELLARGRDGCPPPPHTDAQELHLGFGRIVASETEAPEMLANLV